MNVTQEEIDESRNFVWSRLSAALMGVLLMTEGMEPEMKCRAIVLAVADSLPIVAIAEGIHTAKRAAHEEMEKSGHGGAALEYTQTEMNLARVFEELCGKEYDKMMDSNFKEELKGQAERFMKR